MNIIFGIRGSKHLQNVVTEQLSSQWFRLPKTKDGKETFEPVSQCLQPINLYSYAVPKEYANQVFTSLKFNNERYTYGSLKSKMALGGMRKAMGLQPIPKFQPSSPNQLIPLPENLMKFMHIFPIGIKEDVVSVDEEGFLKERI